MEIDQISSSSLRRSKRLKTTHSKNQSTTSELTTTPELTTNDLNPMSSSFDLNDIKLSPTYSTDNSINSTFSSSKSPTSLYKLFKRLKIRKDILKGLKSMDLKDVNYKSIDQHKLIYNFLNDNINENIYIRSKPYNKIIAYLISCLEQIDTSINQIQIVIIPSTVELGNHIYEIALQLTKYTKITVKSISADNNCKSKFNSMLLISTIGTIVFCLIKNRLISFDKVKLMIFDEYDLINTNKNFFKKHEKDDNTKAVSMILNKTNLDCKHIYLSTFIENGPLECAKQLSNNILMMDLLEDKNHFFNNVLHFYIEYDDKREKYLYLKDLLLNAIYDKVLVFVVGKFSPQILQDQLNEDNIKSLIITTDTSNEKRIKSLKEFQNGSKKILVLNYPINVGIDFGDVNLIIAFDLMGIDKWLMREYYHKFVYLNKFIKPSCAVTFTGNRNQSEIISRKLCNFYNIDMYKLRP